MIRKARAGHVTGGRVFGYDNVEVRGPNGGARTWWVNQRGEAAVVRCIFELCADGAGLTRITKTLNKAGRLRRARSRGGRRPGLPSSVGAILLRPLYRGEISGI